MKRIIAMLAVLIAALTLLSALTACSGSNNTQKATEAPTESGTENPYAKYLPLTNDTAIDYMYAVTGIMPNATENLRIGAAEDNGYFVTFTIDDKYYYYLFDASTGEIRKKYEGVDEEPSEAVKPTESETGRAISACEKLLPNFGGTDAIPENIKVKKEADSTSMIISMTWDGVSYEFIYDSETDTATQTKP